MFNLVPCDNEFEKEFAQFLEKANDVARFAKLPEQFGFAIEYTDNAGNLRCYEPDFVVRTNDGTHYIVETKGLEDVNVAPKRRAAELGGENASRLTNVSLAYLLVRHGDYAKLQPTALEDLMVSGGCSVREMRHGWFPGPQSRLIPSRCGGTRPRPWEKICLQICCVLPVLSRSG